MNFKKYIAELKRRNVFKSAIAYLVVAWLIIQVASILLPTFGVSDSWMKILVKFLLMLFPIWLVFSWMYDITSKGITRTSDEPDSSATAENIKSRQRLNRVIIGSLIIALIVLIYTQFQRSLIDEFQEGLEADRVENVIAVLPFLNNKPDPDNDYLGFAIADQIIGDLNYLKNITVRPSSAVRKYSKEMVDYVQVKEDLNVDYMITGNYIKEGEVVRLSIELVELGTNKMLWHSNQLEVNFENTFQLQDLIAEKVIKGLNVSFSDQELSRMSKDISKDPLGYEYYLRSLSYPLSEEGDELAIGMLSRSIELDSLFAPAHAELGFRNQRYRFFGMENIDKVRELEEHYVKALELNPELLSAMGYLAILYAETSRIEEALMITRRMLEINPNHASSHFSLGYIYRYIGMLHESADEMEIALKIDPKNINYSRIGVTYVTLFEYERALNAFSEGETSYFLIWKAMVLFRMGEKGQALEMLDKCLERSDAAYVVNHALSMKYIIEKKFSEALNTLKKIEEADLSDSEGWYFLAVKYAMINEQEKGLECLAKAVELGYYNFPFMNADPLLMSLKERIEFEKTLADAKTKHLYFKNKYFD